jgi:hypothetical protein
MSEYHFAEHDYWYRRGRQDAQKGRPALFLRTRGRGIVARGDVPDNINENVVGPAYIDGYHSWLDYEDDVEEMERNPAESAEGINSLWEDGELLHITFPEGTIYLNRAHTGSRRTGDRKVVWVLAALDPEERKRIEYPVKYDSEQEAMEDMEAINALHEKLLRLPAPSTRFESMGPSAKWGRHLR